MSGPVAPADVNPLAPVACDAVDRPTLEVLEGRPAEVGGMPVTRLLPKRQRRTVGAWCFVDHFGPADIALAPMNVGPHPHIGLQTVTWVLEGVVLHRDSLGSEQLIRPGQLNLMTAGRGVSHAEETLGTAGGALHGLQLWVAQPDSTRFDDAAFEHHAALPGAELGDVVATVLVGEFAGARSPARTDTPLLGVDLAVAGPSVLPLHAGFEHALLVVEGEVGAEDAVLGPGRLAYLGQGREELRLTGRPGTRAVLLGGEPFREPILMWWNFVARSRAEIDDAVEHWEAGSDRFGEVRSGLPGSRRPSRIGLGPRPDTRPRGSPGHRL